MKFANILKKARALAAGADISGVDFLAVQVNIEGEENGFRNEFFDDGDKRTLRLPDTQMKLAEEICSSCDNVIVLLMAGSAIDLGELVTEKARAILCAWYPGAMGGLAAAELMAGKYSPSGRLPVTFYRDGDPMPAFTDYAMKGRTYRYLEKAPRYPFGYGLSYTKFGYSDARLDGEDGDAYRLSVTVTNEGGMKGTEKAQVYAKYADSRTLTPNCQLCGLAAVELDPGESRRVSFVIPKYWVSAVLEDGTRTEPDGEIAFYVGGSQPDERSLALTGTACRKVVLR